MIPNFDRIARPYRWLEYLALGTLLERVRFRHLGLLSGCRQALVLGDGDGRFTARLLASNCSVQVQAVDLSRAMLNLLQRRCSNSRDRLRTVTADARGYTPSGAPDLVVTHFFLDCLTQAELAALVTRLRPALAPGALWLVSDFHIPPGPMRWFAAAYVRLLYAAFRVLTGLRITALPDHKSVLQQCGFVACATERSLFGMLTAELWKLEQGQS